MRHSYDLTVLLRTERGELRTSGASHRAEWDDLLSGMCEAAKFYLVSDGQLMEGEAIV